MSPLRPGDGFGAIDSGDSGDPFDAVAGDLSARAAFARLDRRRFLGLGLVAAGSAVLPTGCGGVPDALRPPAGIELRQLSPRGYATFTAAAMRLAGPAAAAAIGDRRLDAALAADRWADREPGLGEPISLALSVLEFAVPPLVPKWWPFTRLAGDAQDRVLAGLMTARLDLSRDIFRGVRSLVFVSVYGSPEGVRLTGRPGPFGGPSAGIEDAMTYDVER